MPQNTRIGLPESRNAGPIDLEAVKTLLRMKSPSNMTPTGDGFVDKRRAQILGGDDELAPSEFEQHQIQDATGGRYSRDMIADAGISALKRKLGLQKQEHQRDMEKVTAPAIIRGEYDVRSQTEAARAAAERLAFTQEQIGGRQEQNQQAIMDRLNITQGGMNSRQEDQQAFKVANPTGTQTAVPAQLYDAVNKARSGYDSLANNPLSRALFGNGRTEAYRMALTNVLDRKGTLQEVEEVAGMLKSVPGQTIDEKIANSGVPGLQTLDPYERQYLGLKLTGK